MSWINRVIWQEGMFLRAQYFQQQDRWLEALVRGRTGMLRLYPWGMTAAVSIPLQDRRHGVRVGALTDRSILRGSNFVLSVQADVPSEILRRLFPAQVKIGTVEHIRELVNVALPGISIRLLGAAPRQIRLCAGATYFELDRNSPYWQQMRSYRRLCHPRIGQISRTEDGTLGYSR